MANAREAPKLDKLRGDAEYLSEQVKALRSVQPLIDELEDDAEIIATLEADIDEMLGLDRLSASGHEPADPRERLEQLVKLLEEMQQEEGT